MRLHEYTQDQRTAYRKRLQSYLAEQFPLLPTRTLQGLRAFNAGVALVRPLIIAEKWAKTKTMRTITTYPKDVEELTKHLRTCAYMVGLDWASAEQSANKSTEASTNRITDEPANRPTDKPTNRSTDEPTTPHPNGLPLPQGGEGRGEGPQGLRPTHVSEYLHLLPLSLQQEYPLIKQAHTDMDALHARLKTLVLHTPNSSRTDRKKYALAVRAFDCRIASFYRRCDAYWELSQGRVVEPTTLAALDNEARDTLAKATAALKSLGLAPQGNTASQQGSTSQSVPGQQALPLTIKPSGSTPLSDLLLLPEGPERDNAITLRVKRDKFMLRRTDRAITPEAADISRQAAEELHSLGYLITQRQVEVCATYGYDVPLAWREPIDNRTSEEKYRDRHRRQNEKVKEQRRLAREERQAAKEAAQAAEDAENPYLTD